jgi:ABC-type anion transport system duplicated permease subunit
VIYFSLFSISVILYIFGVISLYFGHKLGLKDTASRAGIQSIEFLSQFLNYHLFGVLGIVCPLFVFNSLTCIGSILLVDLTEINGFVTALVLLILLLDTLQLFINSVFLVW